MNKIYLLLLGLLPYTMVAQYTDIINSNLPGNSQSAYAVGPRVLQMEGGLWYEHNKHKITNTEMHYAGINYAVRYGFFKEQLEGCEIHSHRFEIFGLCEKCAAKA